MGIVEIYVNGVILILGIILLGYEILWFYMLFIKNFVVLMCNIFCFGMVNGLESGWEKWGFFEWEGLCIVFK